MDSFELKLKKAQDLTLIVFSGKIIGTDLIDALTAFYESEITANTLWDFSNCDVTALTADDLSSTIKIAKSYASLRRDGKSAFVGNNNLAFGLGRMYSSLAEVNDHPIPNETFRTVDDALGWLNS